MQDKCGVVGVQLSDTASENSAALPVYYALYALQHRGQEGAGIVTCDGFQQHSKKGLGLVADVFDEDDMGDLPGDSGIGHIRYPTSGKIDEKSCHPFTVTSKQGSIALGHNGNLVNTDSIRDDLESLGHAFTTESDTEVMVHDLSRNLLDNDLLEAIERSMRKIDGAYSITMMHNDTVIGIRDPLGIRPLCIGKLDEGYIIASESVAIDVLDGDFVRDVRPGEVVVLDDDGKGFESYQLFEKQPAHCFFEYVYFARPDSEIDGRLVYDMRRKLGRLLYERHGVDTDIVSPVPDSGRAFATGYAEAGDIEYAESLMKNRYVGRTFIMPTQDARETAVRLKLNTIASNIEGKTVTLIDDSVVRGTTSNQLVKLLKDNGAEEVHMRIGSPPIISPCYLGINMASRDELMASDKSVAEIRDEIGADSLEYLDVADISEALDMPKSEMCTGCVTEEYPMNIEGEICGRCSSASDVEVADD
ncbi:MAG: amidophosphoribosyltransferase [Halobacteria archaeon]|nr:amidophosphoribosyltransferase [Halobacteria archaeon]